MQLISPGGRRDAEADDGPVDREGQREVAEGRGERAEDHRPAGLDQHPPDLRGPQQAVALQQVDRVVGADADGDRQRHEVQEVELHPLEVQPRPPGKSTRAL